MRKDRKTYILITFCSIVVLLLMMLCASRLYFDKPAIETDATIEECQYYVISAPDAYDSLYVVIINNADTLVAMPKDSVFLESITRRRNASWINRWWFPSCNGTLASRIDSLEELPMSPLYADKAPMVLSDSWLKARNLFDAYEKQHREIDYYISSHSERDEGFYAVSRRKDVVDRKRDSLATLLYTIESLSQSKLLDVRHRISRKVVYRENGKNVSIGCTQVEGSREGFMLFQTIDALTPDSVRPVFLYADSIGRGGFLTPPLKAPADTIYIGARDMNGRYTGFGQLISRSGYYYEGAFLNGKRHDFGVAIDDRVRAGKWKEDKFIGEQPVYSSSHVYGIDISRYQHEKGKKRYNINWNDLRITSLGTMTEKKIEDAVNYPISFVYIKCSQGTNILNRYYAADYKQSRKHRYITGSYHFFSTKTSGIQQAKYFLKHCQYHRGDLPPVLDVEPTDAQIRAMGGDAALQSQILAWMAHVETALGIRPVLYCSLAFINKHLKDSYITANYNVWIARYGEYKPDLHLVYWQICPDGRVNGIKTEVDINVFNGYSDAFDEFIIKH